ncbi:MAG: hypothetical protein ABIQ36_13930 [Rhodanobacter sp.]
MAGFGWLTRGISVGLRHPKPLLGGAAFLLLAVILPSLVTLPIQMYSLRAGAQPSPAVFGWIMLISMLLGLLIVPLYAGYLQVIDAVERGLPVRAIDVFKPYRQGEILRLVGYGLALIVIYVVMIGLVIAAAGGGIASWYMQVLSAQANHQTPPGLPPGFGIAMTLFMVLGLFMMGFYAISLGQVALGRRSVFGAIGDGLLGALKNVLPLLVFMLSSLLAWIVFIIAFVIVAMLLAMIAKLVGAWLLFVLIIPLYIVLVLAMFTVMFGVMYHLWRDVCSDDSAAATAEAFTA